MKLGERLLNLRKEKHLSQEEAAEKLNVTRQTISKWETDQSTPDFDKILPLCNLYGITSDELLTGEKNVLVEEQLNENLEHKRVKRAKGIGIAILLYFIAIIWIMISVPVMMINPIVASAVFLLIIAMATSYLVYTCVVCKEKKKPKKKNVVDRIEEILALIFLIIYLIISFVTFYWHITWLIWIVYALVVQIIKLIFALKEEEKDEK